MLAVTHTVTSAAIGVQVQSALFAFGIAFLFHHLADTLLHWNIYTDRHRWPYVWIVLDVLGGLLLTYWLMPDQFVTAPVLAAIVGGNLPDLWHGGLDVLARLVPHRAQTFRSFYIPFHEKLQHETLSPVKGLVWQVALVGIVLLLL